MNIEKAIKVKLQWRKDNYSLALADEMNADMLSIEALKIIQRLRCAVDELLPGETS